MRLRPGCFDRVVFSLRLGTLVSSLYSGIVNIIIVLCMMGIFLAVDFATGVVLSVGTNLRITDHCSAQSDHASQQLTGCTIAFAL